MKHFVFSVCALLMGVLGFVSCSTEDDPKEVLYTVTFNSCGGSEVKSQTVKPGELVVKPENPTKEGALFTGWFTSESYDKEWDFLKDAVNSDMTLYAQWNSPKEALTVLVNKAVAMNAADYSYSSFNYMTEKLKEAKDVLNNAASTEEDITKAYQKFSFVLDRMIPMLTGKEGAKELVAGAIYGYVKDDEIMIYPGINKETDPYRLYNQVYFNVLDELGLSCNDYYNGMKLDCDEEALNEWTVDGNVENQDIFLGLYMKREIQPTEEKVKVTATLGELSKTVNLKICDLDMAMGEFKSLVDTYPQGDVTFDNAAELWSKHNEAHLMIYYFIGTNDYKNASSCPEKVRFDEVEANLIDWTIMPSLTEINGDYIAMGKSSKAIYGYESEGEFPVGKIYTDWIVQYDYNQPDENGQYPILHAYLMRYDFKEDGKFTVYSYIDSEDKWEEDMSGEYKYDGENIIMHITGYPVSEQAKLMSRVMTQKPDFRNFRMK